MKTLKSSLLLLLAITFMACDNDDEPQVILEVESSTMTNLHAPQETDRTVNPPVVSGDFVKFSFADGSITESATEWDIAFRGTTILVNGGTTTGISEEPERTGVGAAYIQDGVFAEVNAINELVLMQDGVNGPAIQTGSGNGWYNYNPATRIITPIIGRTLVIKTHDGKFAKMEILSYYKDQDESQEGRYYTFNYVYQPNAGSISF